MPRDVSPLYDSLGSFDVSIDSTLVLIFYIQYVICVSESFHTSAAAMFFSNLFAALRAFNEIWKALIGELLSELWLCRKMGLPFPTQNIRWMKTLRCVQRVFFFVLRNSSDLPWQETPPRFNRLPTRVEWVGFSGFFKSIWDPFKALHSCGFGVVGTLNITSAPSSSDRLHLNGPNDKNVCCTRNLFAIGKQLLSRWKCSFVFSVGVSTPDSKNRLKLKTESSVGKFDFLEGLRWEVLVPNVGCVSLHLLPDRPPDPARTEWFRAQLALGKVMCMKSFKRSWWQLRPAKYENPDFFPLP